mmetsp:Transcript_8144/g.33528  ORF Transcript_8144/g.33528 Transcript_8144/m.33528 type:complete len:367 (+) Transcript_8144:1076-2176(+)
MRSMVVVRAMSSGMSNSSRATRRRTAVGSTATRTRASTRTDPGFFSGSTSVGVSDGVRRATTLNCRLASSTSHISHSTVYSRFVHVDRRTQSSNGSFDSTNSVGLAAMASASRRLHTTSPSLAPTTPMKRRTPCSGAVSVASVALLTCSKPPTPSTPTLAPKEPASEVNTNGTNGASWSYTRSSSAKDAASVTTKGSAVVGGPSTQRKLMPVVPRGSRRPRIRLRRLHDTYASSFAPGCNRPTSVEHPGRHWSAKASAASKSSITGCVSHDSHSRPISLHAYSRIDSRSCLCRTKRTLVSIARDTGSANAISSGHSLDAVSTTTANLVPRAGPTARSPIRTAKSSNGAMRRRVVASAAVASSSAGK